MSIARKIEHKGQCIEIVLGKANAGDIYKYRIKYFPKRYEGNCAWKMLQCPTGFSKLDEAIKIAKLKINTEIENGNWVKPTQKIFKDCENEE